MKKEDFVALGIEEKLAEKAAGESEKELAGYVPKTSFDEVSESKKQLEASVNDYKAQLETLKSSAGDNENLRQQIAELQEQNKKKDEEHQSQIKALQLTNAIRLAVADSAQDSDLVAGLIDTTKLILGDDGKVTGLEEQIKALKESKGFLFKEPEKPGNNKPQPGFRIGGAEPGGGGDNHEPTSLRSAIAEAMKG